MLYPWLRHVYPIGQQSGGENADVQWRKDARSRRIALWSPVFAQKQKAKHQLSTELHSYQPGQDTKNSLVGDLCPSTKQPCRRHPRNIKTLWPSPWARSLWTLWQALERSLAKDWRRRVLTRRTWSSDSFWCWRKTRSFSGTGWKTLALQIPNNKVTALGASKNGATPSYKVFSHRFLLLKSKLYITSSVLSIIFSYTTNTNWHCAP